jgi:hypothetical protein
MKVTLTSILGNKPKEVRNVFEVASVDDADKLIKACITDKHASIKRSDGKEIPIVANGCVYIEVFNQKNLLVDWCNQRVDEFPNGGMYAKSSI